MKKLSLRQILILGVGLGILLPALVLGYFLAQNRYERELDLRVHTAKSQYAEMLSSSMAVPLWNLDKDVARQFVQAVMRNPEVVRVTVQDEFARPFVQSEIPNRRATDGQLEERPVLLDGKVIGKVTVELSTGRIKQDLIEDFLQLGGALIIQVLVSFTLILLLFERRIVHPLQRLLTATAELARGKLDTPLTWSRPDEIGHLAQGLDKMRQDLGALIADRDLKNAALQQELNERLRAQEALRLSEKKFAAIFHSSPVAMSVFRKSASLTMIDVNEAWIHQFGWSRESILASPEKQAALWRKPKDLDTVLQILESWREIQGYEAWLRCGDRDKNILCLISGRLISLGEETLMVLVQEDITEKRHNEQEILTLNSSLEKRVSERTHALKTANSELTIVLEDLQRAQKELLRAEKMAALGSLVAGVAHELNTPIGTSVTVASTMQQQTDQMIVNFQQGMTRSGLNDYLQNSRTGTDILLRNLTKASELVTSFKQVAIDQSSANRRMFKLDDTVAEVILVLSPVTRKSRNEILYAISPKIVMESYPGALGQVLTNLISNAFIHGFEEGVKGTVIIEARELDGALIEIVVTDNGKGIPDENMSRIFDPFFTTRLGQGGSGLGLNIVYNLVTGVLGGNIVVTSTVNQSTKFCITLPAIAS